MKLLLRAAFCLPALLLAGMATADEPVWTKVALRFQDTENVVTDGGLLRLCREYRQDGTKPIVFEAEEASAVELLALDTRIGLDAEAAGGAFLHFVKKLEFRFDVVTPGKYQVRSRVWFPLPVAAYSHHECMDDGTPQAVTDSTQTTDKVWYWNRGAVYDLSAGRHRFTFPSPTAFCGGARLDKLVLFPVADDEVSGLGPPASPLTTAETGQVRARRVNLKKVREWRLTFEPVTNGGTATAEFSHDEGQTWTEVRPNRAEAVPTPKPHYLHLRFRLAGVAGRPSPWLEGVLLQAVLEPATGN